MMGLHPNMTGEQFRDWLVEHLNAADPAMLTADAIDDDTIGVEVGRKRFLLPVEAVDGDDDARAAAVDYVRKSITDLIAEGTIPAAPPVSDPLLDMLDRRDRP